MTLRPCFLLLLLFSFSIARAEQSHPNVLFILIDDFGWKDVGYNGSTFYETPRIDELAKESMRFDTCYTPSPMCSPTRLSILTGKNPARHGVTQWLPGRDQFYGKDNEKPRVYCPPPQSPGIEDNEVTLGETLQDAGYETAFYGKWHIGGLKATGGPKAHGYAEQKAIIESNRCSMFFPFRGGNYFPDAKKGDNFTDLLTDAAIEFVTRKREQPFYLHLCHFAMHSPIESKPELREKFQKKRNGLPPLEKDRVPDEFGHKPQKYRQDNAEYAGELATLDENIGRLIDSLKDAGLYDNTIIVFTGDNGGRSSYFKDHPTSNQPLRTGKTFLYEGGLRTPLLIHWPGKDSAGKQSTTPVNSMDFYPTILEMAGLPPMPKQHLDGVSLAPLFEDGNIDRDTHYWHFPHYQGEGSYPASAIRKGDSKLIHHYHHDQIELFDLASDPNEATNLAETKPELAKELQTELFQYLKETGAYIPQAKQ